MSTLGDANGRPSTSNPPETHMIVLPGGGYAEHAAHEAEPIADWLSGLGIRASVFRYPLLVRHPLPTKALRAEIRRLRHGSAERIGLIGFSAGGHLAGLAALTRGGDAGDAVDFAVLGRPPPHQSVGAEIALDRSMSTAGSGRARTAKYCPSGSKPSGVTALRISAGAAVPVRANLRAPPPLRRTRKSGPMHHEWFEGYVRSGGGSD